jgi:sugar O-acyltransferase (sialic acid O-acetyltransferase NeuD family)
MSLSILKMLNNNQELLVIGAGGHARAVIDAVLSSGKFPLGLIDLNYKNQEENILSIDVLGNIDLLNKYNPKETSVIIAIGDNHHREEMFFLTKNMGFKLLTVIHQTANISKSAVIGEGVFVSSGAIINSEANIGDNTIINSGVIVEHETNIGSHCHLAPGVKVGGRSSIEKSSFIGIGSSIANSINIGHQATIGAGSVIIKDVESNSTVVGIGRVVK